MATRDELVERLSHEDLDVRARAIMQLAKGRGLPDSHPFRAELRELEPELQRAIDSLEEPQRSEVTEFIEILTTEWAWTVEE